MPAIVLAPPPLGAARRTDCGSGLDLGISLLSDSGLNSVDIGVGLEKVGTTKRRSIGRDHVHRF